MKLAIRFVSVSAVAALAHAGSSLKRVHVGDRAQRIVQVFDDEELIDMGE